MRGSPKGVVAMAQEDSPRAGGLKGLRVEPEGHTGEPVRHSLDASGFGRAVGTGGKSRWMNRRGRDEAIPRPVTVPDNSFSSRSANPNRPRAPL